MFVQVTESIKRSCWWRKHLNCIMENFLLTKKFAAEYNFITLSCILASRCSWLCLIVGIAHSSDRGLFSWCFRFYVLRHRLAVLKAVVHHTVKTAEHAFSAGSLLFERYETGWGAEILNSFHNRILAAAVWINSRTLAYLHRTFSPVYVRRKFRKSFAVINADKAQEMRFKQHGSTNVLVSERVQPKEIHNRMRQFHSRVVHSQQQICIWKAEFQRWREPILGEHRSGRLGKATNSETAPHKEGIVSRSRQITCPETKKTRGYREVPSKSKWSAFIAGTGIKRRLQGMETRWFSEEGHILFGCQLGGFWHQFFGTKMLIDGLSKKKEDDHRWIVG